MRLQHQLLIGLLLYSLLVDLTLSAPISRFKESDVVTHQPRRRRNHHDLNKPPRKPVFTEEEESPVPIYTISGHQLDLKCKAKGNPMPTVTWYKDGVQVTKRSPRPFSKYRLRQWILSMDDAKSFDNGFYECIVSNEHGSVNRTFEVQVDVKSGNVLPIIRAGHPGNHTVVKNSSLRMECRNEIHEADDPPMITWYHHATDPVTGGQLMENGHIVMSLLQQCTLNKVCRVGDDDIYLDVDPEALDFTNVNKADAGWYTCKISNKLGTSFSSGYLTVLDEPPVDPEEAAEHKVVVAKFSAGGIVVLVIFCSFLLSIVCWRKVKKERHQKQLATETWNKVYAWTKVVLVEKQETGQPLLAPKVTIEKKRAEHTENSLQSPSDNEYEFVSSDPKWEINRDSFKMTTTLGEGAFGRVRLAETLGERLPPLVAVKMLKDGHSDQDLIDLVKEMEIMKVIGSHPNIINLLGVCTQPKGKPLYLIVEYAKNGNLKDFLRRHRPGPITPVSGSGGTPSPTSGFYETPSARRFTFSGPPPPYPGHEGIQLYEGEQEQGPRGLPLKDMLIMAYQVSKGMQFLASMRCVHRDLAARNVLIAENMELKIADFGMARDLHETDYYRKNTSGRVPLKWMAPESVFERICTSQSDVWSFGILMWEIVTLGDSPFKDVPSEEFAEGLRIGRTLSQPTNCPDNVFDLMRQCWRMAPKERPEWESLVNELFKLHADAQPNVYLELTHMPSPPVSPGHQTIR